MRYDPIKDDQLELVKWSLDRTTELLETKATKGWMGRWLDVLKEWAAKGFHPDLPPYGFGDPTSYNLIDKVVGATASCGAVRHGAECFNFYFPQDLDEEFLIVWDGVASPTEAPGARMHPHPKLTRLCLVTDPLMSRCSGFESPPWRSVSEPELRDFLLARCKDGYSFPINPVWPIRDKGWYEVLNALKANEDGKANLKSWFPPHAGVLERIETLHAAHPEGFAPLPPPVAPAGIKKKKTKMQRHMGAALLAMNLHDLDTREMGVFVEAEVRGEVKMRWRRVRNAFVIEARLRKQMNARKSDKPPAKLPPIEKAAAPPPE